MSALSIFPLFQDRKILRLCNRIKYKINGFLVGTAKTKVYQNLFQEYFVKKSSKIFQIAQLKNFYIFHLK